MTVPTSAGRQPGHEPGYDPYGYDSHTYADARGDGWISFAGVLVGIVAILNTIGGIAAIDDAKFYVNGADYVIASLHTWGWIVLCIGVVQFLVALGIFARNQFARWTGVFVLAINAIAQLLMLPAYPFWALSIFTMDIMAMYGLIVYGARLTRG